MSENHPQKFDHYVSLGINCEVDFQFRRVLAGHEESGYFATGMTRLGTLLSLLNSGFAGICQPENLVYTGITSLVKDVAYDYTFHWVGPGIEEVSNPDTEAFVRNSGRLHYLAAKFRRIAASGDSIAFFYACHDESPYEPLVQVAELLETRYGAENFKLIVVQTIDKLESDWEHPRLHNRYVERFAPWGNVIDASERCWDRIFAEFPFRHRVAYDRPQSDQRSAILK